MKMDEGIEVCMVCVMNPKQKHMLMVAGLKMRAGNWRIQQDCVETVVCFGHCRWEPDVGCQDSLLSGVRTPPWPSGAVHNWNEAQQGTREPAPQLWGQRVSSTGASWTAAATYLSADAEKWTHIWLRTPTRKEEKAFRLRNDLRFWAVHWNHMLSAELRGSTCSCRSCERSEMFITSKRWTIKSTRF